MGSKTCTNYASNDQVDYAPPVRQASNIWPIRKILYTESDAHKTGSPSAVQSRL
jgi:hypothetical protein